jgi:glycosyltransferase involved in cell wall biosynthesis
MNPKISVLMPVFNGQAYLEWAVDSVLAQTFPAFEFVIVDDGSKDKTPEILKRYAGRDGRIRIYTHGKNRGIVDSLNLGLEKCGTDYVARMDADDICESSRLAEQHQYLENHRDHVLVGTQAHFIDAEGNRKGETRLPTQDTDIRKELFYGRNVIFHSTVMFKNNFAFLYRAEAYPAEDYDLWLRLLKKGKAANLNERLMDYRLNPGGVSFLNAVRQVEVTQEIRDRVLFRAEEGLSRTPGKTRNLYGKCLQKISNLKLYSAKWLVMKALLVLLNPSELIRMKYFRWIEKYSHYQDYAHFVHGAREPRDPETSAMNLTE